MNNVYVSPVLVQIPTQEQTRLRDLKIRTEDGILLGKLGSKRGLKTNKIGFSRKKCTGKVIFEWYSDLQKMRKK